MRLAVAFTANNRPHYLTETLGYWARVRGGKQVPAFFYCEPGHPEVLEAVWARCPGVFQRVTVEVNQAHLGPLRNPHRAYESVFAERFPFVVLAEDDSLVSTDVLEYFSWAADHYEHEDRVLAVCAFQRQRYPGGLAGARRGCHFRPTIWGTWEDRWRAVLEPNWDHDYSHHGWDWHIQRELVGEQGFQIVAPCESRSQVSGQYGGAHLQPQMYEDHLSDCFAPDIPPQEYREVHWWDAPS